MEIYFCLLLSIIRRQNAIRRDELVADVVENIRLKLQYSSWFSIRLLLHRLYRFFHQINSIYECVIIESNVLQWNLYLIEKVYPAKSFSIHRVNTSGLKLNFEKEMSIQCFRRRPQQVRVCTLHCDVECFDCNQRKP